MAGVVASSTPDDGEIMEVPDAEGEHYGFLRLYSIDLNMAQQSCELFASTDNHAIKHALLRDLIISYARPFSGNRSLSGASHRIGVRVVPKEMRELHRELFALRKQAFAHTDPAFRRPQIARWPRPVGGAMYGLAFTNPSYESLTTRIGDIVALICAVEGRVNAMVRECELRFERLYAVPVDGGVDVSDA